jgi:HK97 family phage major capsid protein
MDFELLKKEIQDAQIALKTNVDGAQAKALEAFEKANGLIAEMALNKDASTKNATELDALRKDLNTLSANMNKPGSNAEVKKMSFEDSFYIAAKEKKAEIDSILASGGRMTGPLVLNLKAIGLNTTVEASGSASQVSITQNTGIISDIRTRITSYLTRVSQVSLAMDNPIALWMEMLDSTGTPIFIAEAAEKTEIGVRFEERNRKAKKIAVFSKITTEFLRYLPQLVSHIQNFMMKRVDIATENQLFTGDGTGNNLKGVMLDATLFTGGDLNGKVASPTGWDVMLGVISQVRKASGVTNGIYVKGGIVDVLLSTKDADGRYIVPAGVTINAQGEVSAFGVPLIRTEANLGSFDFMGGDLSVINVGFTGNMTVQIEMSGDDFIKNLKTVLVEQELVQFVSANDTQVLVKGLLSDAIEELDSAV